MSGPPRSKGPREALQEALFGPALPDKLLGKNSYLKDQELGAPHPKNDYGPAECLFYALFKGLI